ncbi:MAG: molybdate ABC transporter substrate-binding protein [Xanthobacteraceae bacterium]
MEVLCTNGLKTVLIELLPAFERARQDKVTVTWGSANGLLKELEGGAGADIAILTAEAIDALIKQGKAAPGSRLDIASSGIALAMRKGATKPDISSSEALKRALLAAKTVAHSKTGTSGIYFPTVLAKLGISEQMQSKIVNPEPGTPVGVLIARGEAEIGVQQMSELLPVAGIEIIGVLPSSLQKVTTFSAAILRAAKKTDAARALLEFIATESPRLLAANGLEPPTLQV